MQKYEYLIIGFGKGGKTLAYKLGMEGHSVLLIEKDPKMFGGTCINVACIPTKVLVNDASLSSLTSLSHPDYLKRNTSFLKAMRRKSLLVNKLRRSNYMKLIDVPSVKVIVGKASFIDAHNVSVNNEVYSADTIIINTGSRPFIPPIKGVDSKGVYVSETLLKINFLPHHLVIVGGGYIGLEFASMFLNFGSKVTLIQKEEAFLPREDSELASLILNDLILRGLKIYKNTNTLSFSSKNSIVSTEIEHDNVKEIIKGDAVLLAVGRRANLEGLDLYKAGVNVSDRGLIVTDEHKKTNVPNIYALGDCAGALQFTYISLDDSRIVYNSIKNNPSYTLLNRGNVPYSVFINPPFSRIGLSEEEARKDHEILVGRIKANAIPKAHILNNINGLLKVIVDKNTHEILGAHLYCNDSQEMINIIKMAMDNHIKYDYIKNEIFTHPSMSESLNDVFGALK